VTSRVYRCIPVSILGPQSRCRTRHVRPGRLERFVCRWRG
jgi:hypothetical protein